MADVVRLKDGHGGFVRHRRLRVRNVLKEAKGCEEVLLIGVRDGELWLRGCPNDPAQAMWLMELAKKQLLGL